MNTDREKEKKKSHGVKASGYLVPSSLHCRQFRMAGAWGCDCACCVHGARVGDSEMTEGEWGAVRGEAGAL